mmetsp:Transcript_81/g.233  ORF Transcript_81/g.233 Transcript_81/m.233 type:complete len:604 (-) Transcript_81:219-2030(-)|eukprot:CAMPEP_0194310932 /NCGR_PEP_ID=MMETSP0171-20130528/7918_1 /TAXON_ID=218684 /ORGANISM="Corethron pennatum, Strain L29A3" /LENGTH=603 /DNA_ID=CAMNT_0039064801 /DNA_START=83 /DNA_END=1894 /DNA_ORIENTATION=+
MKPTAILAIILSSAFNQIVSCENLRGKKNTDITEQNSSERKLRVECCFLGLCINPGQLLRGYLCKSNGDWDLSARKQTDKRRQKEAIQRMLIDKRVQQAKERAAETENQNSRNSDLENNRFLGLFSKGMMHDGDGIAMESSILKLERALESGLQSDFDAIQLAPHKEDGRKPRGLINPQGGSSFEFMGQDPEGVSMPSCPSLNSREAAGELVEVFEHSMLRDYCFSDINEGGPNTDLDRPVASLNAFHNAFKGPKEGRIVTRKTLFRGIAPGAHVGPYVSQLLQHPVVIGAQVIEQKYIPLLGEYGITQSDFIEIQNGFIPVKQKKGLKGRFVSTPRDLGSVVRNDFIYQQHLYGLLILLDAKVPMNEAFPDGNKNRSKNEEQFLTAGGKSEIGTVLAEICRHAQKAAWVQKWENNMRLRPEAMAGRLVEEINNKMPRGTVSDDLVTSETVSAVTNYNAAKGGDRKPLVPLQYDEGSPTHPSYPSGHAVVAGACMTILKIYFQNVKWARTNLDILESIDGLNQRNYTGADVSSMTVHGEMNKLASNIAIGRNMAGIHYRSDADLGMMLGEKVAIQYFKDLKAGFAEEVGQIYFIGFDGKYKTV